MIVIIILDFMSKINISSILPLDLFINSFFMFFSKYEPNQD